MRRVRVHRAVAPFSKRDAIPTGGPAQLGGREIRKQTGSISRMWPDPWVTAIDFAQGRRLRFTQDDNRLGAFTLIELVVAISIIVLLMSMLFPALSLARRQSRAVACRANLRQRGLRMATFASENEGCLEVPVAEKNQSWQIVLTK